MTTTLEGGEWSAARPGRSLSPGKDPVPILQEAWWASGPVWTGGKTRPHRNSILDRPARSQSLYRLSYPAHTDVKHKMLIMGYNITYTIYFNNRIAAIVYTVGTWVVSDIYIYIIVNTLHKGDNK